MRILFICKYNKFRSKVAEAIFNSINKNKKIKAESAGFTLDKERPYIEPVVIEIMKRKGYKMKKLIPRKINLNLLKKFDMLIITANNVYKNSFKNFNGKIIKWKIKDCPSINLKCIKTSINKIEMNIKRLVKELKI